MSIRTVNLVWEQRIRQTYPVARYALRDDGALTLAVPRPLEARTYDRTLLALDGGAEIHSSFSVETLIKLEMTPHADHSLGMTNDDLYLFQEGGKNRFLGERHVIFLDAALSEDGQHLFTAFSDIGGASYALAYGEIGGRVAWTADMENFLTAVTISRLGNRVVAGGENGRVFLMDASRRGVWEFGTGEPIRSLACSRDGVYVAYGTAEGGIGLIDGDGTRRWEARLPGEVSNIALSGDGKICAALCRPRQEPNNVHLCCLNATGQTDWEYASEQMLLGLTLSDNGLHLATGTRNGTTAVYNVVLGEGATNNVARSGAGAISQAQILAESGDLRGAVRILEVALQADSTNLALFAAWQEQRAQFLQALLTEAQAQDAQEEWPTAMATLESLLREEPLGIEAVTLLADVRRRQSERLYQEATHLESDGQETEAEKRLLEAISLAPVDSRNARAALGELRERRSRQAEAEAERLLAEGQLEAGVAALERAQAMEATEERAERLMRAQTAMEFAAGMTAYNAKEYQEAIFQFKKVLARDADHAEAKRYLGFAQSFLHNASNESLNDRFRRLE